MSNKKVQKQTNDKNDLEIKLENRREKISCINGNCEGTAFYHPKFDGWVCVDCGAIIKIEQMDLDRLILITYLEMKRQGERKGGKNYSGRKRKKPVKRDRSRVRWRYL